MSNDCLRLNIASFSLNYSEDFEIFRMDLSCDSILFMKAFVLYIASLLYQRTFKVCIFWRILVVSMIRLTDFSLSLKSLAALSASTYSSLAFTILINEYLLQHSLPLPFNSSSINVPIGLAISFACSGSGEVVSISIISSLRIILPRHMVLEISYLVLNPACLQIHNLFGSVTLTPKGCAVWKPR